MYNSYSMIARDLRQRIKTTLVLRLRPQTWVDLLPSLAGQPLHKKEEEGSGIMPIRELYLLQPGVQPNQIAPRHHQYYEAVPNTNQVPDLSQ